MSAWNLYLHPSTYLTDNLGYVIKLWSVIGNGSDVYPEKEKTYPSAFLLAAIWMW